jgi:hypothetical protein
MSFLGERLIERWAQILPTEARDNLYLLRLID